MRHKSPVNRNIGLCRYGSRVKTLTLFTWTGPGCFTFRLRLLLWWWWRWLLSGWEICRLLIGPFTQSLRAQCPAAKLQPSSATGLHQTGALDYLKTVRIRGKIKAVCCDLGQCSLLFKWTIWRPLWRHAGCIQFSNVNILPSQSLSARRAIFLQIIQLIFINCSFAKINTIVFANLQTRCEVARYFFANDQGHFSQLPSCK